VAKILQQWIGLISRQPGVSLFVSVLDPFKRLLGLAAKRLYLSDLISRIKIMLRDKLGQSSIRVLLEPQT